MAGTAGIADMDLSGAVTPDAVMSDMAMPAAMLVADSTAEARCEVVVASMVAEVPMEEAASTVAAGSTAGADMVADAGNRDR
jgi:hypothetical protein